MISFYTGTPRSGKSLDVARLLIIKAKAGYRIIANFPITPTKKQIKKGRQPEFWTNDEITPDSLLAYARKYHKYGKEGQTILVIDECHFMFNSRDIRNKDRPKWIDFFSQHGKYGFDIYLITQNDRLIDKQIRAFVEYNVIHRKINNFGIPGLILSLLRIKAFVAVTMWYGMRERISADFYIGRRKLYKVYDSYRDFSEIPPSANEGRDPLAGGDPRLAPAGDTPESDYESTVKELLAKYVNDCLSSEDTQPIPPE